MRNINSRNFFRMLLATLILASGIVALSNRVVTMPEYSEILGTDCAFCHVDSAGGGELTEKGTEFQNFKNEEAESESEIAPEIPFSKKSFWLLVGFVHFAAGFIWLGTIIYIHLVLKPAYAASGLPRSELKLAWLCMFFIGLSGALLVVRDFSSAEAMLSTNFGRIIAAKIIVFLTMVSTAAFVTLFIGPRIRTKVSGADEADVDLAAGISESQLGLFDGEDSRKAYVSVDEKVYDVSESRLWKNGSHMKRHKAGADMTSALDDAPHGREVMDRVPEVSKLIKVPVSGMSIKKVFYFLAYLNLVFVFTIIFLLSLLRFWRF